MDAIDRVTVNPSNIHVADVDNVNIRPDGNSRQSALRRLRKDRPDLHSEVLQGKLSPHAAMVQAGFRRKIEGVDYCTPSDLAENKGRGSNKLEVKTVFANWIQRYIKNYDFIEGIDFFRSSNLRSERKVGSEHKIEYYISLNMAKELSMVQNNPKGMEIGCRGWRGNSDGMSKRHVIS